MEQFKILPASYFIAYKTFREHLSRIHGSYAFTEETDCEKRPR